MKKLLIISPFSLPYIGGLEKQINSISELLKNDYDVYVYSSKIHYNFCDIGYVSNYKVIKYGYNLTQWINRVDDVIEYLRLNFTDVILFTSIASPIKEYIISLKEKKPCNIIFRLPTTDHIDRHLGYNGYKILKEFDGIVVLNHHDLNMLESFCEHVYFIPNVIIPFRGVTTEEKDESIFITSRVTKTKNIKLLLEITKILSNYTFLIQISKNFNDCLFYYQTLVSLKKRKNVYIVRQSLDNSCWFGRCKYYVSTSISDGLSNSIIEALFNNNLVFCLPTVSNRYFSTCVYFYENASQLRHLFLMQKNGTLESENKQKAAQKLLVQHQKNYIAERWNIFLSLIS